MGVQVAGHIETIVDAQGIGISGAIGSDAFDVTGALGAIFRFTATNTAQLASVGGQWSRDGGSTYGTLNSGTGGVEVVDLASSRDLSAETGLYVLAFGYSDGAGIFREFPTPHDHVRLLITNSTSAITGLTVTMQKILDSRGR